MNLPQRTQGFALVTALMFIVVLSILTALVMLFTLNNLHHTRSTVQISRTLALAQGARNFGAALLGGPISQALGQEITYEAQAGSLGVDGDWIFDPTDKAAPDSSIVAANLQTLATNLQNDLSNGGCYGPYTLSGSEQVVVRMTFTGDLPKCDGSGATTTVKLGYGRFLSGGLSEAQTYALPYVMVVSGIDGEARRTLTLTGQYNFTVGNGSFSRYALYTDIHQQSSNNAEIFFTSDTLFDGPVHTNGNFAFYDHPWFGGPVSSAGQTDTGNRGAWFMSLDGERTRFRRPSQLNPPTYRGTTPQFTQGVDWKAQYIPLPDNDNDQKAAAQNNGLYISGEVDSLKLYAGDGTGAELESDGQGGWKTQDGGSVYQYIKVHQESHDECEDWDWYWDWNLWSGKYKHWYCNQWKQIPETTLLYRYTKDNDVLQEQQQDDSWKDYTKPGTNPPETVHFNGVIYADGDIDRFTGPDRPSGEDDSKNTLPAIASFAQLDVVSPDDIRITGDLRYQDTVCDGALHRDNHGDVVVPNCTDDPGKVKNVLGIYSSGGDILIGAHHNWGSTRNAPENVAIDATMMTSKGEVTVEDYDYADCSGTVYLLGGIIEKTYGAFGTFISSGYHAGDCSSGFGRSFTYDPRFDNGLAPPFFPTVKLASLMAAAQPIIYAQTEQTNY